MQSNFKSHSRASSAAEAKFKSRNNQQKHPRNFSICAIYIQRDNSEDNDENVAEKEVEFHADDAKFMQLVSRNFIKTCSIVTNKFLDFFLSKSYYILTKLLAFIFLILCILLLFTQKYNPFLLSRVNKEKLTRAKAIKFVNGVKFFT